MPFGAELSGNRLYIGIVRGRRHTSPEISFADAERDYHDPGWRLRHVDGSVQSTSAVSRFPASKRRSMLPSWSIRNDRLRVFHNIFYAPGAVVGDNVCRSFRIAAVGDEDADQQAAPVLAPRIAEGQVLIELRESPGRRVFASTFADCRRPIASGCRSPPIGG